jgi:hypothetical protein
MRDPAYVKLKFKKHSMVKKGEKQNLDPDWTTWLQMKTSLKSKYCCTGH